MWLILEVYGNPLMYHTGAKSQPAACMAVAIVLDKWDMPQGGLLTPSLLCHLMLLHAWQGLPGKGWGDSSLDRDAINPLCPEFVFIENINMYLPFISFSDAETSEIDELYSQGRQEYDYFSLSISWLLMTWRRQEPGHHQPWYWPSFLGLVMVPKNKS